MKKITTYILSVSFALFGPFQIVAAQTTTDPIATNAIQTATTTTSISATAAAIVTTEPVPVVVNPELPVIQNAFNIQSGSSGSILETTTNPEASTSTQAEIIPIVSATSTEATSTPVVVTGGASTTPAVRVPDTVLDVVTVHIDATVPDSVVEDAIVMAQSTPGEPPVEQAIVLDEADLVPSPDFAFALTGKTIPTKRVVQDGSGKQIKEEVVTVESTPTVDNANGVMYVSGVCSDAYFVVLLFKNQNDYADDPASYIVNRAYPCVAGTYSYSISELPYGLKDGNYYLLVGEQGERGAWKPITGLTEITINNNQ